MTRAGGVTVLAASRVSGEVIPARAQMAATLGFHIILACLGIALPAIVLLAEFVGLRRRDQTAMRLVIGPSFALLFALQGRRLLHADEAEALPAVTSAGQTQPPAAPWGQPPADQSPVIRAIVLALVVLVAFFRRLQHR